MPQLQREFAEQLHISLAVLRATPVIEAFDAVAMILDIIGVTLFELKRQDLHQSFVIIQSGASAMLQIKGKYERTGKVHMTTLEFLPIANAVNACLEVLPKLSVTDLYIARQKVVLLK
ncbi:MAG TPA: hypothetical protein VM532_12760 [Burkholderiales bacterium]|jgi:hypothetical protein|nr:hypothetical protein [Burkholderiales bacterium]